MIFNILLFGTKQLIAIGKRRTYFATIKPQSNLLPKSNTLKRQTFPKTPMFNDDKFFWVFINQY